MNNAELEKILINSLSDFKLDQDEKILLKNLSLKLREDQLNFVRNKSFELSRPYIVKGGEVAVKVLSWLERVVKSIQANNSVNTESSIACFSPGSDCRNKIISLLKLARKEVDICVFTISDNRITDAILDAHNRGIRVTIISDNDKANDRGSDIDLLSRKGVQVILDNSPYHMHHKFALFDRKLLLNGSFNWTRSASEVNEENILVTAELTLVNLYHKQFDAIKSQFLDKV